MRWSNQHSVPWLRRHDSKLGDALRSELLHYSRLLATADWRICLYRDATGVRFAAGTSGVSPSAGRHNRFWRFAASPPPTLLPTRLKLRRRVILTIGGNPFRLSTSETDPDLRDDFNLLDPTQAYTRDDSAGSVVPFLSRIAPASRQCQWRATISALSELPPGSAVTVKFARRALGLDTQTVIRRILARTAQSAGDAARAHEEHPLVGEQLASFAALVNSPVGIEMELRYGDDAEKGSLLAAVRADWPGAFETEESSSLLRKYTDGIATFPGATAAIEQIDHIASFCAESEGLALSQPPFSIGEPLRGCKQFVALPFQRSPISLEDWLLSDLDDYTRSLFIGAASGGGKSTLLLKAAGAIADARAIPIKIYDPVGYEFGNWAESRPDFQLIRNPLLGLSVNPLRPPKAATINQLLESIRPLIGCIASGATIVGRQKILACAANSFAIKLGLKGSDIAKAFETIRGADLSDAQCPTWTDFIAELRRLPTGDRPANPDTVEFLWGIADDLETKAISQVFGGTTLPEEIFEGRCVIELSPLDHISRTAVFAYLVSIDYLHHRTRTPVRSGQPTLKNLLIADEIHCIAPRGSLSDKGVGEPTYFSAEQMARQVAEQRKFEYGMILSDQSPADVHRALMKNTGYKLFGRLDSSDDLEAAGDVLGLEEDERPALAELLAPRGNRAGQLIGKKPSATTPVTLDLFGGWVTERELA